MLHQRLTIDFASAAVAGFSVTPIVVVLDSAVTEAAFGRKSTMQSMVNTVTKLLSQPHRMIFTRPFVAMYLLYSITYMTANVTDTLTATNACSNATTKDGLQQMQRVDVEPTSSLTKLYTVCAVNMLLSLNKDNQFAKAFGTSSSIRALPLASYAPLILRDAVTLFASFNLPPMLAPHLPDSWEPTPGRLAVAQLLAPAASQFLATPLHLLGLDLYHRNYKMPVRERIRAMGACWIPSSFTRMARIVPGLAFGNVLNTKMRTTWTKRMEA